MRQDLKRVGSDKLVLSIHEQVRRRFEAIAKRERLASLDRFAESQLIAALETLLIIGVRGSDRDDDRKGLNLRVVAGFSAYAIWNALQQKKAKASATICTLRPDPTEARDGTLERKIDELADAEIFASLAMQPWSLPGPFALRQARALSPKTRLEIFGRRQPGATSVAGFFGRPAHLFVTPRDPAPPDSILERLLKSK